MEPLKIDLPQELRQYVEQRTGAAGLRSPSEFVRELIERDQKATARMEALVRDGIASGGFVKMDDAWWEREFARLDERLPDDNAA
jgi:Arc/MetJ-type ribon-helix-helix transcriptional regulator